MITIVNYGMGNLGSLQNMLKRIGVAAQVASEPEGVLAAEKLILPGVGAFDAAMRCIGEKEGLREALDQRVLKDGVPVLGVCLGMQLLTDRSEEGELPGLGWIKGRAHRFPKDLGMKVPHMGWNIALPATESPLVTDLGPEPRYYFVHSYYVKVDQPDHAILTCRYGLDFAAGIGRENIYGVQFHPEKSHRFGMQILKNFSDL